MKMKTKDTNQSNPTPALHGLEPKALEFYGAPPFCSPLFGIGLSDLFRNSVLGFRTLIFCIMAGFGIPAIAQNFQTVDDFQYIAGQDSANYGLAFAPNGILFASGFGYDTAGFSHGLVMASADAGNTWSVPLDDYLYASGYEVSYDGGMAIDPGGNIYVAGEALGQTDVTNHWLIRRSSDGGGTWSTVDDYHDGGSYTGPHAIASDSSGNIYVAGYSDASPASTWVIRKSVGGNNFTTVDSISSSLWMQGAAAIYVHPTAGVFAAGVGPISTNVDKRGHVLISEGWLVRRSTDGGATWSSVDKFALASGSVGQASGIGTDTFGNIYVVGCGYLTSGTGSHQVTSAYWIVRKSTNGGGSWGTVDSYQLATGHSSCATAFKADSKGNLYVAGWGNDTTSGPPHWIVRENTGGTNKWSTVDDFPRVPGLMPLAMEANSTGNVFVGGGLTAWGTAHWLIRRK